MAEAIVTPELAQGALLHFEKGVPICDLSVRAEHKQRMARVEHVYWQFIKNPFLEPYGLFRQLVKGKYADAPSECRAAQKDKALFDFVVKHVVQNDRSKDEIKVRWAVDRAMKIGAQTDDWKPMLEGAKVLTKVARLDQPESEQADMSKAAFLQPVVTTSAHEVDETKEDLNDRQSLAIMNKYGAYIDEKRKAVEDRVEAMMANRGSDIQEAKEVMTTDDTD